MKMILLLGLNNVIENYAENVLKINLKKTMLPKRRRKRRVFSP